MARPRIERGLAAPLMVAQMMIPTRDERGQRGWVRVFYWMAVFAARIEIGRFMEICSNVFTSNGLIVHRRSPPTPSLALSSPCQTPSPL